MGTDEGKPIAKRYLFSGHAVGAAAHFHRLGEMENLDHCVPALAPSVLPITGGVSRSHAENYSLEVDHPRRRTLFSVRRLDTAALGKESGGRYMTNVWAEIEGISVLDDKLRLEQARLHMLSARANNGDAAVISTEGTRIDGLWLGNVRVEVEIDDEPLRHCGSQSRLADFFANMRKEGKREYEGRFFPDSEDGRHKCSLVKKLTLHGPEKEKDFIHLLPDGYSIRWEGFGRIILGEILVKGQDRQLTLMRLAMGSDAAGSNSVGDGQSGGTLGN
jgi:hypothetical protein